MRKNLADSPTPVSLLRCLQGGQAGPEAWRLLVDCYGPPLVAWSLRRGLQPADADDVAQEVLIKLFRRLPEFKYDPAIGFRPYL
jgi:RNA polymerase sigma-70 factor (ECF subfamily)